MTTTSQDAKTYLANRNIPALFESLMTGLMYNRPTDHIAYLQECLGQVKEDGIEGVKWNAFIQLEMAGKGKPLPPIPASGVAKSPTPPAVVREAPTTMKKAEPLPPIGQTTQKANTSIYNIPQCPIMFVFGGPGSGKRTQIKRLVNRYQGWTFLSMGNLLKKEIANQGSESEKWQKIVELVNGGELAPEEVALDLLGTAMAEHQTATGLIIEGFPRNLGQVELYTSKIGRVDLVVMVDCEELVCQQRLMDRMKDAGSSPGSLTTITDRIARFKQTLPVAKYYDDQEKVAVIEGDKPEEAVFFDLCSVFEHVFYNPTIPVPLGGSIKFPKPPPLSRPSSPGKRPRSRGKSAGSRPISGMEKIQKIEVTVTDNGRQPNIPACPVIFLMGGPGSGKGSIAAQIVKRYPGFVHLSMGDILRTNISQKGSADAKWDMITDLVSKGEMAPEEVTIDLVVEAMKSTPKAAAFIIEGYPRNKEQVEQFNATIGGLNLAILLDCDEYSMQQRLAERQTAQERIDDNPTAISKRISFFKYSTLPVAHHYDVQGKLTVVNADKDMEEVFFELSTLFDFICKSAVEEGGKAPTPIKEAVIEPAVQPTVSPPTGDKGSPKVTKELDALEKSNLDMKEISDRTVVFVVGGPGSGKGTQCKKISAQYGFCHLSSGDLLRAEVESGSELGQELTKVMESGQLVPIETILTMLKKAMIHNATAKGFLIDGYPREVDQGKLFEDEIKACDFVLNFEVKDETLVARLLKRAETSGRADDNEETIKKRLATFHEKTQPLVDHYGAQDKTKTIPSEGTVEDIFAEVEKLFESMSIKGIDTSVLSDHDVIFVLGGSGSGKTTQGKNLMKKYGYCHISTGDLLREEMDSGSSRGDRLREIMQKGDLVPMDAVIELLKEEMIAKASGCKGFLIDGFPREVEQATRFEEEVKPAKCVIFFDLPEETMKKRIAERAKDSGRVDDNEATVERKIKTFNEVTKPTVEHFSKLDKVITVNAEGTAEEVFAELEKQLEGRL